MQELLHLVIRPTSQVFLQGLGCETNIRAVPHDFLHSC